MSNVDYTNNARKSLFEAQIISQEANSRINIVKDKLVDLERSIIKSRFIKQSIENQVKFLQNNILHDYIEERLINKEWAQVILNDLVNNLKYWNPKIKQQVSSLEKTENTLNVLREDEKSELYPTLGSFISHDNLSVLEARINEIPNIQLQMSTIKSQYNIMLTKLENQLIKKDINETFSKFEIEFNEKSNGMQTLITVFPRKTREFESELVDFLKSFTNHFEQCQILSNMETNTSDYQKLFEIVKADNNELHLIFQALGETVNVINRSIDYFTKHIDKKIEQQNKFNLLFKNILNTLRKNFEYLLIFKEIADIINTFKKTCLHDINYIKELYHFYQNFELSYQNLLQEVERRKQVALEMRNVIKVCEAKLQDLSKNDALARNNFLKENGDYLPENIWPSEMQDSKPLYSLEYSIRNF